MVKWKIVLWILLGLTVIAAAAVLFGQKRWKVSTDTVRTRLKSENRPPKTKTVRFEELNSLPAPVQRYFRTVLTEGQCIVSSAHLKQAGTFNMGETEDRWKPFIADQYLVTHRPGFIWDARISMIPGLSAKVYDAYAAGEGMLHASLFGLITLADMRGSPDIAEGEFMRFFAEAPWYPTALLPSQGVQWEPVDDRSAQATMKAGKTTVTMRFRFDENGLIESIRTEARWRTVGGKVVATPWEGRWRNYERRDGMMVPLEGEAVWMLPEGPKAYWRGRVTDIRFEFVKIRGSENAHDD